MAPKKSSKRSGRAPRGAAKVFFVANLIVWGAIGGWYLFQPAERKADVSRLVGNWMDGRKHVTAFEVAWDLWQLYGSEDFVATRSGVSGAGQAHVYGGALPQGRKAVRVLENAGYATGYSEALGNPLWVAYRSFDVPSLDAPKRPEEFRADLRTSVRVEPGDFSRSGYDRGHLAPNYAIATRYGATAQEETFLMSNITPQKHALNAGPWRNLEQKIATSYAARFGEVWVIAGPIFSEKPRWLHRRVAVPDAFFMIVVDESEGRVRAEAFILPQEAGERDGLEQFVASIDDIEARTGFDFLSALPDDAENRLESKRVARVW